MCSIPSRRQQEAMRSAGEAADDAPVRTRTDLRLCIRRHRKHNLQFFRSTLGFLKRDANRALHCRSCDRRFSERTGLNPNLKPAEARFKRTDPENPAHDLACRRRAPRMRKRHVRLVCRITPRSARRRRYPPAEAAPRRNLRLRPRTVLPTDKMPRTRSF